MVLGGKKPRKSPRQNQPGTASNTLALCIVSKDRRGIEEIEDKRVGRNGRRVPGRDTGEDGRKSN